MDSSENDEAQDLPISPSEPRESDLADEETFPPSVCYEPGSGDAETAEMLPVDEPAPQLALAEPGWYYCDEPNPGIHPQLGQLLEGENDFTEIVHPEALQAITALLETGHWSKA